MVDKLIERVKQEAGSVLDAFDGKKQAGTAASGVAKKKDHSSLKQSLKDMALQNVVDRIDKFDEALPVFESVGFTLKRIDIEVGLSPGVMALFEIHGDPSEAEQQSALARVQQIEPALHSVMNSMLQALRLHHRIRIGELDLVAFAVTIGMMPSVKLVFGEEEKRPI